MRFQFIAALFAAGIISSAAYADTMTYKLCIPSQNSPPCPVGMDGTVDADAFNARFGTTWQGQQIEMGKQFCTFTENDKKVLVPYSIVKVSDMPGGHGGTAVFAITCAR
jgi:hypothetical protein